ncbi:MAG: ABC transporter permease [Actinomycetota bacterium]
MRHLFTALSALALAAALTFLTLPLLAIFLRVPPGRLLDQLGSDAAVTALLLSLRTSLIANALVLAVGTPAAYLVARRRFPGRRLLITLVELPLVLPPTVAGIGLLAAFGRAGLLGGELDALGVTIPFTTAAVVAAVAFVASPFYMRQAIAAFEAVDGTLLDAARTLGAGPWRAFRTVALPLAGGGLAAGAALAFARGIGEFGATIVFAGNLEGVTRTLPLAVYSQLDEDFTTALAIAALLVVFSAAVLIAVKLVSWARPASPSISIFRDAPSASASRST